MRYQRTIRNMVSTKGIGLHTGCNVRLKLIPAPENTGIVFTRKDLNYESVKGTLNFVSDTSFSTNIKRNGASVKTVEHLMAALASLGIDNLFVELDGPEVPALDGSAVKFVDLILAGGIKRQSKKAPCLKITKPIVVEEGHSRIQAFPYQGMKITCSIGFNHPVVKKQSMEIDIHEESFTSEIAPAKTFGFLKDVERLRANGLAQGGTLENSIVLDDTRIINRKSLTFEDEFVRHKILDMVGDLSMLGMPIHAHFVADKPGHTSNNKMLKEILLRKDAWELVTEPVKIQRQPQAKAYYDQRI